MGMVFLMLATLDCQVYELLQINEKLKQNMQYLTSFITQNYNQQVSALIMEMLEPNLAKRVSCREIVAKLTQLQQ